MRLDVDADAVARTVASWTGIPLGKMMRDTVSTVLNLEDRLRTRVVGQDHALEAVAETTGGRYFFAQDRDQLAEIYDELDRIGTRDIEAETYRPRLDLFHWPLAALLVLSLIFHTGLLLRHVVRRRGHAHG